MNVEPAQRIQAQILSMHSGGNRVDTMRARVERVDKRDCLLGNTKTFETSGLNVALVQPDGPAGADKMFGKFIRALSYRSRLPMVRGVHPGGFEPRCLNLLSFPADAPEK